MEVVRREERTGHSMRGGGEERSRRRAKWHDRTCEEGGDAGKKFLMGQKIPGTCTCNLCTDLYDTQGDTAMPHMCKQRCTCRNAVSDTGHTETVCTALRNDLKVK